MIKAGNQIDWYLSNFEIFQRSLNGEAGSHIHAIRKAAIARFAELGFPTTRDEDWKYTDVAPLTKVQFEPVLNYALNGVSTRDVERLTFGQKWARLVCVNGHFSKELSSASSLRRSGRGLWIGSLAEAMKSASGILEQHLTQHARYDENAFSALSAAFLLDGVYVFIPDKTILKEPIQLLFISTGAEAKFVSFPRTLVVVGNNSQVSLIETHVALEDNVYFSNAVSEIVIGENSVVEYDVLEDESERSFHIGNTHVYQERNSTYTSNAVSYSGALVRNNVTAVLDGEGAECTLNGLYVVADEQHVDNHTTIDHAKPHCNSHELYKGILAGKSKGVFNGKILVRKDAQKTDAKQTNKNLVLSDDATMDTKPQLEIFANDVKCTHGATIGQLDEEATFYLRTRGLGLETARDVLTNAFASDVINRIQPPSLRDWLNVNLLIRLQRAREKKEM
ncbi:MAG: Fe-S cluster assembly protein SufD [Bacteroidota bacterium]